VSKPQKSKRIRIYVSKKRYDKINKYAKEEDLTSGGHIIDELMKEFIDKHDL